MDRISKSGSDSVQRLPEEQPTDTNQRTAANNPEIAQEPDVLSRMHPNEFENVLGQVFNSENGPIVPMEGSTSNTFFDFGGGTAHSSNVGSRQLSDQGSVQGGADFGGSWNSDYKGTYGVRGHQVETDYGVDVDYNLGADGKANYDVDLNDKGGSIDVGGEAFAGAKGSIEGTLTLNIDGEDLAGITIGGEAWAGAGVEGGFHAGFSEGRLSFGFSVGGGAGAGGSWGIGVTIDFGAISDIFGGDEVSQEQIDNLNQTYNDAMTQIYLDQMDEDLSEGEFWNRQNEQLFNQWDEDYGPKEKTNSTEGTEGTDPADDPDADTAPAEEEPPTEDEPPPQDPQGGGYTNDFGDSGFPPWMSNVALMSHLHIPGGISGGDSMDTGGGDPGPDGDSGGQPGLPTNRTGGTGSSDDDDTRTDKTNAFGPYLGDNDTIVHPKANSALVSIVGSIFSTMDIDQVNNNLNSSSIVE